MKSKIIATHNKRDCQSENKVNRIQGMNTPRLPYNEAREKIGKPKTNFASFSPLANYTE
jgi:hypothetical protein